MRWPFSRPISKWEAEQENRRHAAFPENCDQYLRAFGVAPPVQSPFHDQTGWVEADFDLEDEEELPF